MVFLGYLFRGIADPESWRSDRFLLLKSLQAMTDEYFRMAPDGPLIAGAVPRSLQNAAQSVPELFGGEVLIIDENDRVAVSSAAEPLMSGKVTVSDLFGSENTWLTIRSGRERIMARTLPVKSGWRVVYLGPAWEMNRYVITFWFAAAAVLLSIGFFFPFIMVFECRHITRPLKTMAERARGFSQGTRVLVQENYRISEIDYLNTAMCEMMDTITERENTLRLMNDSLEDLVEERTRAYQETIEKLRSTRDQLLLSERMAALGSLVSGIAHEINTPMSIGITAASYMNERTRNIMAEWDAQNLTREALEQYLRDTGESSGIVLANLDHAARIIKSLKQVAVDQQLDEHREFDLVSYIKDIIMSLKHQLRPGKHQIALESGNPVLVDTYPGVITQVINNLVFNSITHGFGDREGGQIRISARDEGDDVILVYRDDGRGLAEDELKHIFEPFYTTRRGQGGTGLGMNIVQNLVRDKLKGSIEIAQPEGGGAGFVIRFPRSSKGDL
jgi:signal transduction histidine kinase